MKIKLSSAEQKIIKFLLVNKRFRRAYEIEPKNFRINTAIKKFLLHKIIEKKSDGYFYLTDKNSFLKFMASAFDGTNEEFKISPTAKQMVANNKINFSSETLTDIGKQIKKIVK